MSGRPRAEIVWTDAGPRSGRFDDMYFAPDGLEEARGVFLRGCGLPDAWAGRRRFTVAELGFGTGLNILALLQLWRERKPPDARLHVFTVEAHPLAQAEARRALAAFPEVADLAEPLLALWPGRRRGVERIELPELGAVIDVATADVSEALEAWEGRADAWFLDGFAPARNPEMWSPRVLDLIAAHSAPGARLATFTVAGAVRRGLADRGFTVERAPGHGRKKERLEARWPGEPVGAPSPRGVIIVGGGIAGASLARAFLRAGVRPILLDPAPGSGASGNPCALISPRLDAGNGPAATLSAQSFLHAASLFRREAPEAVVSEGVLKLAADERDERRFAALAESALYPDGAMEVVGAAEASQRLGEPCGAALWIEDGLTVAPQAVLARWTDGAEAIRAEAAALERVGNGWRVLDGAGALLAEAEVVCLACGAGLARWRPEIEPVSGQASWTEAASLPGAAASWGGYAAPLRGGGVLFGATHERGVLRTRPTPEADARNLHTLAEQLPGLAAQVRGAAIQSRASARASTPDRLPTAGAIDGGLFVLGGLGGRGFTWAPLLAEHVAAKATGAPSPLPLPLGELVAPERFERRAARRRAQH